MAFTKAEKGKKPVRLIIGGPSGSGKTFTGLTFAKYLAKMTGKPTAAVDTEFYRMSLYADKFDFDVNNFQPPFNPEMLVETIHEAERAGYGQLIIDSSSHFYAFEGGLLQIVQDAAKKKGGNQYAGWEKGTPLQNNLIDTIIRSPLHIIFCTRAKQAYVEGVGANGKKTYEKVGMELIQRDSVEFDFDFFIMMDMDNNGSVQKGMGYLPTGAYVRHPGEETIALMLKSITENSTENVTVPVTKFVAPKPEDIVEVTKRVKENITNLYQELGGKEVPGLLELFKSYDPSGNPFKVMAVEKLKELETKLIDMKNIKEIK